MKPIYEQWAEALESGEFVQCRGALRVGDKFCVIGVLHVLARRAGLPQEGLEAYSPAAKWAGLKSPNGEYTDESGNLRALSRDNDGGATFPELAATIRKYRDQLFIENH